MYEKLVVVTRKTRLQQLIERFNTRAQAKFYLEHAGLDFSDYAIEDETYRRAHDALLTSLDLGLKTQVIERELVCTYLFAPTDVVVALGQDGVVANTAKYVGAQPLVGVNPDPARYDGPLLPFDVGAARRAVERTVEGSARVTQVTLAEAVLSDGQRLLAFNDFFLGMQTHASAQYRVRVASPQNAESRWERQSSSGIIVATGAGSTGWLSSVWQMAASLSEMARTPAPPAIRFARDDARLFFAVREPFVSRQSSAACVAGWLEPAAALQVESLMPTAGVVFSDGVERDCLSFTSGLVATIRPAAQRAHLVVA